MFWPSMFFSAKLTCVVIFLWCRAALVAVADTFVTHAWSFPIDTSLKVMHAHTEAFPGAYFYFDVLSSNLHQKRKTGAKWWAE